MLFTVCSAVTVECCDLYTSCVGLFGMCAVMLGRRLFSSVLAITERRDMGMYEVPLSMSFFGFGMGTMLAWGLYAWYYVGVKSSFQHAREECESKRAYVF